jgi:hypothetical protein
MVIIAAIEQALLDLMLSRVFDPSIPECLGYLALVVT